MVKPISFTSDYKVKIKTQKTKNKQEQKKQEKKENNYFKFLQCCEKVAYGLEGVMFSEEDFSDDKIHKGKITLHVPNELDSIVESYLRCNNIKFKKKQTKQ